MASDIKSLFSEKNLIANWRKTIISSQFPPCNPDHPTNSRFILHSLAEFLKLVFSFQVAAIRNERLGRWDKVLYNEADEPKQPVERLRQSIDVLPNTYWLH